MSTYMTPAQITTDTKEELMQICREGIEFVTGRPCSEFMLTFVDGLHLAPAVFPWHGTYILSGGQE